MDLGLLDFEDFLPVALSHNCNRSDTSMALFSSISSSSSSLTLLCWAKLCCERVEPFKELLSRDNSDFLLTALDMLAFELALLITNREGLLPPSYFILLLSTLAVWADFPPKKNDTKELLDSNFFKFSVDAFLLEMVRRLGAS